MNAQEILTRSLKLLEEGDARGWCDLFVEDGVLQFPYAPEGWPKIFEGRDAIWQHMQKFPEHISVKFSKVKFYATESEELAIGEFSGSGKMVTSGAPFEQEYISVVKTRGDKIALYRDFWNPLLHLKALGGAEAALKIVKGG
ncbi:MAG: nuclear transport factor 2 family protein [Myxococcota bacterium]